MLIPGFFDNWQNFILKRLVIMIIIMMIMIIIIIIMIIMIIIIIMIITIIIILIIIIIIIIMIKALIFRHISTGLIGALELNTVGLIKNRIENTKDYNVSLKI